jgi:hypothetical protein
MENKTKKARAPGIEEDITKMNENNLSLEDEEAPFGLSDELVPSREEPAGFLSYLEEDVEVTTLAESMKFPKVETSSKIKRGGLKITRHRESGTCEYQVAKKDDKPKGDSERFLLMETEEFILEPDLRINAFTNPSLRMGAVGFLAFVDDQNELESRINTTEKKGNKSITVEKSKNKTGIVTTGTAYLSMDEKKKREIETLEEENEAYLAEFELDEESPDECLSPENVPIGAVDSLHLDEVEEIERVNWNRMNLIIVGEQGVGKTSLFDAIRSEDNRCSRKKKSAVCFCFLISIFSFFLFFLSFYFFFLSIPSIFLLSFLF